MITHPTIAFQPAPWQRELARAVTSPVELLKMLDLDPAAAGISAAAQAQFRQRVPRGFIARMRRRDPHDPLLRQVLPLAEEEVVAPGFSADPVGDLHAQTLPGVLQKYAGRALLVTTGACAIHCRYCFRRHFPYADANPATDRWEGALRYLAGEPTITEIILSGGDPLSLADSRLAGLADRLAGIPHLRRLRLHTRLPVVLPERVDGRLLAWLAGTRLTPVVVIHANHTNEIDDSVRRALNDLRRANVTLLNQSVLLRGVNDSTAALCALSESLFEAGVLPYYLHTLDPVQGAAHFEVDRATASALIKGVRRRLPGYLVPKLVREQSGAPYKLPAD